MTGSELSFAIQRLLPLVVAAGVDPYLALLFLGVGPLLGWPVAADVGGLADLGSLLAVGMATLLYLFEALTGRFSWAATLWNVANTPVRVAVAASVALLVLPPDPGSALAAPAVVVGAGVLAGGLHLARTGWWLELDLEGAPGRVRLLTAAAEDAVVVALLYLTLDAPRASAVLATVVLAVGVWRIRPHLTAGMAAHVLAWSAARGVLNRGRWRDGSALPERLRREVAATGASDHAVRSTPAFVWGRGIPGRFRRGWLVVALAGPVLLLRTVRRIDSVALRGSAAGRVRARPLHTVVHLVLPDGRPCGVAVPRDGPGPEALRQLFGGAPILGEHSDDDRVTGLRPTEYVRDPAVEDEDL